MRRHGELPAREGDEQGDRDGEYHPGGSGEGSAEDRENGNLLG